MLKQLRSLATQIHLGVRGKLLLPTVATLIIVIIGLSLTLVTVQQRLNRNMRQSIEQTLGAANAEISMDLKTLKSDIDQSLSDMS